QLTVFELAQEDHVQIAELATDGAVERSLLLGVVVGPGQLGCEFVECLLAFLDCRHVRWRYRSAKRRRCTRGARIWRMIRIRDASGTVGATAISATWRPGDRSRRAAG